MGYRTRWLGIGFLRVHGQRRSRVFLFWSIIAILTFRRFENQENNSDVARPVAKPNPTGNLRGQDNSVKVANREIRTN